MRNILLVDGENFKKKIESVFEEEGEGEPDWSSYNFRGLIDHVLSGINLGDRVFYIARIKEHEETKEKSRELIERQRGLKANLINSGFTVVSAGNVKGWPYGKKGRLIFKEKGVDVRIAVDMIVRACIDGDIDTIILGSSDSDLQPAVSELNKRSVRSIYLGFESNPNKGLTYTMGKTILIRNREVIEFKNKRPNKLL